MGMFIDLRVGDGFLSRGYLARPPAGSGPGIVVQQEIFGLDRQLICDAQTAPATGPILVNRKPGPSPCHRTVDDQKCKQEFLPRFSEEGCYDGSTLGLTLSRRSLAMGAFLASALPALRMASTAVHAQVTPQPSGEQLREIQAWARSFAVQAATYAAPIVAMYLPRDTVCTGSKPKARVNESGD